MIVGTKGAASTDVFFRRIKRWEFGDSPESMTSKWVEDLRWEEKKDQEYFHNSYGQNIEIIKRVVAGKPSQFPARDAYETMRVVEAAERSADIGEVVHIN